MKLSKMADLYLDELKGAHEYKEMMVKYPEYANYFKQMHDDEIKHANYVLKMEPKVKEEIQNHYNYLEEELEEMKEIINMV